MSTRCAPSADGLALEYFTVQRASRSFWRQLGGLLRPGLGDAALLQRPLLVLGVALLRRRHHGCVDDLPAHGDVARRRELRLEAPEQRLDRRDAADPRPRQRLAEGPDRIRVRHRSASDRPRKRMNDSRSLIRYSVRSSDSEWLACSIRIRNISTWSYGGRPPFERSARGTACSIVRTLPTFWLKLLKRPDLRCKSGHVIC